MTQLTVEGSDRTRRAPRLFALWRKSLVLPALSSMCGASCEFLQLPKRADMPGFIKPQLATLKPKSPKGDQWLHVARRDVVRPQSHLGRAHQ